MLLILALGCLCPTERDQLQVTADVKGWTQAALDCSGGCGFTLHATMMPEDEGTPHDEETLQVGLTLAADTDAFTVAWAKDIDRYNFPDAYAKAAFAVVVANPVAEQVWFSVATSRPGSIGEPAEQQLSGDECGLLEEVRFELDLDGADAVHDDPLPEDTAEG